MISLSAPFKVTWYITKACNLACSHCYNYTSAENGRAIPGELKLHEAKKIAIDLIGSGVANFMFVGGEPLIKKWFIDLLEFLDENSVTFGFSTNATLFDAEFARRLIKLKGLTFIQFSLDGDRSAHDEIRGEGSFSEVISAANICDTLGLPYAFSMTLVNSNKNSLREIVNICIERRCYFSVQSFVPAGRSINEMVKVIPREEYRRLLRYLLTKVSDGLLISKFPCHATSMRYEIPWDTDKNPDELSCGAGTSTAIIFENGDLGVCDFIREDIVGNLRESSIEELWQSNSPVLSKWREINKVDGCSDCGNKSVCGYGCRANAYYSRGSLTAWDPACVSHTKEDLDVIAVG